jgi:hypothetical protein
MSSNFATLTGTPGLVIRFFTEETVHDASVMEPKKVGDISLAARPSMRITIEPPRGKIHANVASLCRFLDSYRKRNPAPLTRHTGINQPIFAIPNFS